MATATIAMASVIAWGASHLVGLSALTFIYLIGVLLIAVDRSLRVSLYAAVLSVLALDFFFNIPRFSLAVERIEDFVTLAFFFVIAVAISMIGARLQRQVEVTRRNAARTQALYDFNKMIAAAATLDDILQAAVRHVSQSLTMRTVLLLPHGERLEPAAAFPPETRLDTASAAAMDWAWRHGRPAGLNSDTLPGAEFYGLPLRSGRETVGVLAVQPEHGGRPFFRP